MAEPFTDASPRTTEEDRARVVKQLETWRDSLVDLSRGNPLLGINRSRTSKLRITAPASSALFDILVVDGKKLRMPLVRKRPTAAIPEQVTPSPNAPEPLPWIVREGDVRLEAEPSDLFKRLRRIKDNARTTVEERGVTTLHLTVGALHWDDPRLGESVAPLWLIPCTFETTGPDDPLVLQATEEEPQLNLALVIHLRDQYRKTLLKLPDEPPAGVVEDLLQQTRTLLGSDWEVTDEAWLSTFSFETLTMYHDLGTLTETAVSNQIVRAFADASVTLPPDASERLGDDLDAVPTPARLPIPVLPADSSQLEALGYARAGRQVLIHGPPGTGKSQTIANLIAVALGQGKTVLFVSAKMAALEVVYRRLADLGFGRFCLEAHSTKAGKARIIDELRRTLAAAGTMHGVAPGSDLARYTALRDSLNQVVEELRCKRAPLGRSVYEGLSKYALVEHLPEVSVSLPWPDATAVSDDKLEHALDTLADLQAQAAIFAHRDSHPWRGCTARNAGIATRQPLAAALATVQTAGASVLAAASPLDRFLGPLLGRSLQDLEHGAGALRAIAEATWLPEGWTTLTAAVLDESAMLLQRAAEKTTSLAETRARFGELTDGTEPMAACELLGPAFDRFGAWYKRVLPSYFSWKREVRASVRPKAQDYESLANLARLARTAEEATTWLEQHRPILPLVRHPAITQPAAEALGEAASAFARAAAIRRGRERMGGEPFSDEVCTVDAGARTAAVAVLHQLPSEQPGLAEALARLENTWGTHFVGQLSAADAPIGPAIARCDEALADQPRFFEWVRFKQTLDQCGDAGLGPFVEALSAHGADRAVEIFKRRFWQLWADAHIARSPALSRFSGIRREELVRDFAEADRSLRQAATVASIDGAAHSATQINQAGFVARGSQLGILRFELQKKRPRPLRRLFFDIPRVLQAIKPCMLMSPVSVSTYLTPGTIDFDLVVFDEASQIPPQEAIPSILRARQVIVAGDDKQLPPTSFFAAALFADGDGDDGLQQSQPLESLLHQCEATVPLFQPSRLRWHYRSRDERLIAFSNHTFYEGSLITFPSPDSPDDHGVQLRFVENGVWDRGGSRTNRAEARAVADIVVRHLDKHPDWSLGVAAMNTSQKEAIEDALDEALLMRADLRERLACQAGQEPFFIKSLENVQGDERDTIIISVGYGPDVRGTVNLNFGPLNQEGGWRRLNVLVTRAKRLTVLVTSLRSTDLGAVSPTNRGASALRQFIEYAERGGLFAPDAVRLTGAMTNDFEDAIAGALRARGLTLDEQVGASSYRIDLAVRDPRDPTRYVLGIECDGATYHSSRTARDRDLLRADNLRGMGWRLHRVWSIDWFRNPQETIEAALRAVERAQARGGPETGVPAPSAEPTPVPSPAENQAHPTPAPLQPVRPMAYPAGVTYRHTPRGRSNRNLLLEEWRTPALADEIVRVVLAEEPIHIELVLERLKELHGVARAGRNIRANFDRALDRALQSGSILLDKHNFVRGKLGTLACFRVPTSAADTRAIEHIAFEEVRLAALHLVESQFGLPRDALVRETAGLLGFGRASVDIFDRIADVTDTLIEQGELRVSGFQLTLP